MALTPGARLGPYHVLAAIGAGGMGEIYRARDTKLNRDVALKVLLDAFILDPDRLARFKQEAHLLAALNHPNIAAIYGFEDSNHIQALVLELVEGPTLADRLARGPIPIGEALSIARQIAEALEAAHERGIIHRDLKPANIKLRPDGMVKVLDFGLAKILAPVSPLGAEDATPSPTLIRPATTRMGLILGTPAYMSPEQAEGRQADKRHLGVRRCALRDTLRPARVHRRQCVRHVRSGVAPGHRLGRTPRIDAWLRASSKCAVPGSRSPAAFARRRRSADRARGSRRGRYRRREQRIRRPYGVAPPMATHDASRSLRDRGRSAGRHVRMVAHTLRAARGDAAAVRPAGRSDVHGHRPSYARHLA